MRHADNDGENIEPVFGNDGHNDSTKERVWGGRAGTARGKKVLVVRNPFQTDEESEGSAGLKFLSNSLSKLVGCSFGGRPGG